jgi:hypothetical protein
VPDFSDITTARFSAAAKVGVGAGDMPAGSTTPAPVPADS